MDVTFRMAERGDAPLIVSFINELAEYENMTDKVHINAAMLEHQLFDQHSAEVVIACADGAGVGYALFFSSFSTFLGKPGLYLEDLYIRREYRTLGIGKALLSHIAQIAVTRDCARVEWTCLDWNKPSLDFYKSLGAEILTTWIPHRVSGEALTALADIGGNSAVHSGE